MILTSSSAARAGAHSVDIHVAATCEKALDANDAAASVLAASFIAYDPAPRSWRAWR